MGTRPAKRRTSSTEMPASFGVHGPGEMTMRSGARRSTSSSVMRSLRKTRTSAPSSPRYWTRFQVKES